MITTKVGDGGKSWCGGKMVDKDGPLLEAMGSLDELQAGLMMVDEKKIVKDLKEIMGIMGVNQMSDVRYQISDKVEWLEREIKKMDKGDVEEFLVFETKKAREFNLVRTVCRRAERRLVGYGKVGKVDKGILIYINRLSDYLFLKAVLNN